jgi:hypothetical protein
MIVWMPGHRLVYGSDLFQRDPAGGYSFPQTVSELLDAAARNGLEPERFYMMHIGPTAWDALAGVVADAVAKDSPLSPELGRPPT